MNLKEFLRLTYFFSIKEQIWNKIYYFKGIEDRLMNSKNAFFQLARELMFQDSSRDIRYFIYATICDLAKIENDRANYVYGVINIREDIEDIRNLVHYLAIYSVFMTELCKISCLYFRNENIF